MMPMRTNNEQKTGNVGERKWELRPGGMVVQKCIRVPPPPIIRVRVKYGSIYHEIHISSQATFGELKKMLSSPTGLHHEDQKLFYKGKERESIAFLDNVGVRNKSKLILQKDDITQHKRYLEMQRNAKMEMSAKLISEITMAIDKLAAKVAALESVISNGGIVEEKDVTTLVELLMNQLLKLDIVVAINGDVKLQRELQEQRVQNYVETLDTLKLKIKKPMQEPNPSHRDVFLAQPQGYQEGSVSSPIQLLSNGRFSSPVQPRRYSLGHSLMDSPRKESKPSSHDNSDAPVVITTQWETFDSAMFGGTSTSQISHPTKQYNVTWDLL